MSHNDIPKNAFSLNRDLKSWWWGVRHKHCTNCVRYCKQSAHVEVIACPQYSPLNKSDEQDGDAKASIKESLRLEIAPVAKSLAGETS